MPIIKKKVFLLASCVFSLSCAAGNQPVTKPAFSPFYIGVESGAAVPSGSDFGADLNTSYHLSAFAGYHFNKNWRTDLHFDRIQYLNYENGIRLNQYILTSNAYYDLHFAQAQEFVPYLLGGLGWAHNTFSHGSSNFNGLAWQFGLGFNYALRSNFGLGFGYRFLANRHKNSGVSETGYNNLISLSLTYHFAKK